MIFWLSNYIGAAKEAYCGEPEEIKPEGTILALKISDSKLVHVWSSDMQVCQRCRIPLINHTNTHPILKENLQS